MTDAGKEAADRQRPARVLATAAAGAGLLWLAHPPAGLWPLAYVGAACWLGLATRPEAFGRREYLKVWLGGVLYWLLAVHWVRLPCFPLTALGWPPLAMYLALYTLGTVAATRQAVRRFGVPIWLAGPVAWTGLELLQARLFTGFLMGAVSHTHSGQPWVRGVAAYTGAYGVTFAVVLVAALLLESWRSRRAPAKRLVGLAVGVGLVLLAGYAARLGVSLEEPTGPRPRVALVQGDTRATWDPAPDRSRRIMERQLALTERARAEADAAGERLDLVVWPESMFRSWLYTFAGDPSPPDNAYPTAVEVHEATRFWLRHVTERAGGVALMAGVDRFDWPRGVAENEQYDVYNSLLLADGEGRLVGYYDKVHRVPFGEYIPLASGAPALYALTPLPRGLSAGRGAVALEVPLPAGEGVLRLCPTICYESVVPRVVRGHVAELTARGESPDALVNATYDAWFWGASELDMHLACGVYRAVENGLPLLIAANGGLSAIVDARGEVLSVSPRMTESVVAGEVPPRAAGPTFYTRWGDWFAGLCLAAVAALPVATRLQRRRPSCW